jgi:quercetin dioxygenase-like cupin family protein
LLRLIEMTPRNWLKGFSANDRLGSAAIVRGDFLRLAGVVALAFPAIVRARGDTPSTKQKDFSMEIKRVGSQASDKGPADWFTGAVRIDPLFQANTPARAVGASVTFEPGARTAWHTHPLGQTLIVTAGCGWVQREAGPVEEIRPGDVVWFPPGEKHWHGATATTAMTHIAIQEALDGKTVEWMEQVTDEQYGK